MAKKSVALSDKDKAYCDMLAADAAGGKGPFLILGSIEGSLKANADGAMTNAQTIAHLRYLLQAYENARNATIPQGGGDYHADRRA